MAQSGFTPILLYASGTASAAPSAGNLTSSASGAELALNYADGKLFYKDSGGVVQTLATKGTGSIGGSTTQVQYNNAGALAGSANMTFNGTRLTVADLADSSLTSGRVTYAGAGGALTDSANLTFDGTSLTLGGNPTLSAGTANGVLYLNGSKVATSGSALTFDGTNLKVGSVSGATVVFPRFSDNSTVLWVRSNSAVNEIEIRNNSGSGENYLKVGNGYLAFGADAGEAMRLTSTGLGIGTTPTERLDVSGNFKLSGTATLSGGTALGVAYLNGSKVLTTSSAGLTYDGSNLGVGSAAGSNARLFAYANDATLPTLVARQDGAAPIQVWQAGGSEVMRFTASGNLGIGTNGPNSRLQAAYTAPAAVPAAGAGGHGVAVGSSGFGLAGGALSSGNAYLQATRWDGSATNYDLILQPNGGNLGIGTSSPGYRLDVLTSGTSVAQFRGAANCLVDVTDGTGTLRMQMLSNVPHIGSFSNNNLNFTTNNTVRATLDTSGNLGIGTNNPQAKVQVVGDAYIGASGAYVGVGSPKLVLYGANATETSLHLFQAGVGSCLIGFKASDSNLYITNTFAGNALGSSGLTIDPSGNLGIGTNNPGYRLDVRGSSTDLFQVKSSGSYTFNRFQSSSRNWALSISSSFDVYDETAAATRMSIDASGNLGLGVTPSAWSSFKALELNDGYYAASANGPYIGRNSYWNGSNWIYKATSTASQYLQVSGAHLWNTAPSGTAGNAITFTQAMTLTAAGRLGVGVTAPNYTFETAFDAAVTAGSCTALLSAEGGTAASVGAVTNHALLFKTNNTERARITSTGNVVAGGSVALATTATDGFLYVPTCAGTPTGTPTAITGMAPIVVDTTNNKLYFYSGGAWRDAGP